MKSLLIFLALALAACAATKEAARDPRIDFYRGMSMLCDRAFEGRVVSSDPADAAIAGERLVMHVRECAEGGMRISFNVGENRSRTWVLTRTETGLRLKHDHRHEDGSEDALTQYGGDALGRGTSERQEFPADDFSQTLFRTNGIPASVDNVWAMEVREGRLFAYELRRPNRHFRVEFDTSRPIAPPPPSWGSDRAAN